MINLPQWNLLPSGDRRISTIGAPERVARELRTSSDYKEGTKSCEQQVWGFAYPT
jgi:hypothetical protein